RADGIAVTGGRVGRCLFLHGSPCWKQSRASLVRILPYFPVQAIAYPPPSGYHSTGPSVSLLHRKLFRNRRYPATTTVTVLSGNGALLLSHLKPMPFSLNLQAAALLPE
ncbi:hypothetical protein ACR79K_27430, partial [Sphingobacterium siyangense]